MIDEALRTSVFDGKTLTAIGLAEWKEMRWDGAGAAQRRDAIGRVDFVFTATPSPNKYAEQRSHLSSQHVNDRLIAASDAHFFADATEPNRLGETPCWVKADLTLKGCADHSPDSMSAFMSGKRHRRWSA